MQDEEREEKEEEEEEEKIKRGMGGGGGEQKTDEPEDNKSFLGQLGFFLPRFSPTFSLSFSHSLSDLSLAVIVGFFTEGSFGDRYLQVRDLSSKSKPKTNPSPDFVGSVLSILSLIHSHSHFPYPST